MHVTHDMIKKAVEKALEDKSKRKFKQSVEVSINFRGIDFKKPENRFNLDVPLPHGRGKEVKVLVFADGQLALDAKEAGAEVMSGDEISTLAKDVKRLKKLAKEYVFLAEPKLMVTIGKTLGPVLGRMGKLPKPLVGNPKVAIQLAKRTVRVATRGKYLPVVHAPVGTEDMSVNDLVDNIEAVYEKVKNKVGESNIKSMYVKLTMGKPVKVE